MTVTDKIHKRVLVLPESLQFQVLDFVEFLLARGSSSLYLVNGQELDEIHWLNLSLTMAMRGMEDEDESTYTLADLKEAF